MKTLSLQSLEADKNVKEIDHKLAISMNLNNYFFLRVIEKLINDGQDTLPY